MRYDDSLETVLRADRSTPAGAQAAWRQLVDLVGRRRVADAPEALARLEELRGEVPLATRAASARGLERADPPVALVRLLAADALPVAGPVLRTARMPAAEWLAVLPRLLEAPLRVLVVLPRKKRLPQPRKRRRRSQTRTWVSVSSTKRPASRFYVPTTPFELRKGSFGRICTNGRAAHL